MTAANARKWGKFLAKHAAILYLVQAAAGFIFGAGYTTYIMLQA